MLFAVDVTFQFMGYGTIASSTPYPTRHKSQGATIATTLVVNIKDAFVAAVIYVALSRKETRENLHIIGELTPDMFLPVPLSDLGFLQLGSAEMDTT